MAGITAMGMGSGIDIQSLVDQLVAAERAPKQNRLDSQQGRLQTQISAYGALKGSLSSFHDQVKALSDISLFGKMKSSTSDEDAVTVSAGNEAKAGSYQIEVTALARAQSLASRQFGSTSDVVGGGTLTFRFGTVTMAAGDVSGFSQNADRATETIEIAAGSTLAQVRDAVNEAEIGVQAAIINDGSGERLVFSSEQTGSANGFVVEAADDDGVDTDDAGLSMLAFNQSASFAEQTRAGQDASLSINGLAITRASNEIDDAVVGVTLNLNTVTTTAVDIGISRDTEAVKGEIKSFVDAYNALQMQIGQLTRYDAANQRASALTGDALVRGISSNLRGLMSSPVAALDGNAVRSLADLGIITTSDGTLEMDDAKLDKALKANFDEVGALFASGGLVDQATDLEYVSADEATQAGAYGVNITQVATQGLLAGAALAAEPTALSPIVIGAGNDNFSIKIDGIGSAQIDLSHGSYSSGADLAAELQARINGDSNLSDEGVTVSVSFDAGSKSFQITSSRYGSESAVEITAADGGLTTDLGLSVGAGTAGVDVEGTINGRVANGDGQELTAEGGAADGLTVKVLGTALGDRGELTYAKGILGGLDQILENFLDSEGVLTDRTDSLTGQLDGLAADRRALDRRMDSVRERYLAQFIAMDVLVAQMNQTSSFLTQQLANLPKIGNNN